jgi:arabinoxylan arabinofuranohydrolase
MLKKSWFLIVSLMVCFIVGSICYADYPLLKTTTYSADPSCLEYNGRIYSYWSNDDNNNGSYTMHQITCLSTADLKNWTNHGQVFNVPTDCSWAQNSWAPAVVYRNGYFWMYFGNGASGIGVAKSSSPTGPFKDAKGSALINSSMPNCNVQWLFDPGVLVDDNGRVYCFFGGGGPGNARGIEIGSDMISTVGTAVTIDAPYFFEDSWIHKYNGKYYYSYSSDFSRGAATIEYMMSSSPLSGYVHKGTVMPNPPDNSGNNNHHSIFQYRGNWYMGYHNRYVSIQQGIDTTYKRNACLDQLFYNGDGTMKMVSCTKNGLPLLGGNTPTPGPTSTPTPTSGPRSAFSQIEAESFNSQSGIQTESCGEGGQNIGYIENGDYVVFNSIDFGSGATGFQARVASANSGGNIEIRLDSTSGTLVGTCSVAGTGGWQTWTTRTCTVSGASGTHNLYLRFTGGSGYLFNLNWVKFTTGTQNTPTPTPTGTVNTPTPTQPGSYVKFRNVATGLYIDGMGSTSNGANACQYASSTSNNQQWTLEAAGSYYKIKNRATGLYLDGMGRTSNGSICGQWSSSSSNNQQWTQEAAGSNVKYKNRATGLYLDGMGSTGNGSNLCQWSSSSSTNQQFQKQ